MMYPREMGVVSKRFAFEIASQQWTSGPGHASWALLLPILMKAEVSGAQTGRWVPRAVYATLQWCLRFGFSSESEHMIHDMIFPVHTGPLICRSSWALKLAIFIKRGCYVKRCFNRGIGRSKISPGRSSFETMGMIFSQLWAQVFGYTEMRLLMLGMDAAGKTSILYKLKLDENVETIPTLGFNVETLWHGNLQLIVWDIGQEQKYLMAKKNWFF